MLEDKVRSSTISVVIFTVDAEINLANVRRIPKQWLKKRSFR